ncbi:MAG: hypothetical protein KA521_04365 [Crocinitomicaceae bacterium]|nr:hypothetical protein [Crocinitomicaceae bacterium]
MKPHLNLIVLSILLVKFCSFSQNGTPTNPFTSLQQSSAVTIPGTYYFTIGGNSFSTQVDAAGFAMVAIDFGNGIGTLPQGSALTSSARGILSSSILGNIGFFNQTKLTGPSINYISSNQMIANRIKNFKPISIGDVDYFYPTDWVNNGSTSGTGFTTTCTPSSSYNATLAQIIFHACGNFYGLHWIPSGGDVRQEWHVGNIAPSASMRLWIKTTCSPPADPGFGINSWNVNAYSYDKTNTISNTNIDDFNNLSSLSSSTKFVNYGYYTDNSLSINTSSNWNSSNNPSTSSTWSGCTLKNDYFVTQFRRKGFTPGFYKISLPYNADGMKIYLNGSEIYSFNGCCTNKGVVFQGALCSSSELEIRMLEKIDECKLVLNIEPIPWPVDAGANATVIGNTTHSIGTIVNTPNAASTSNTWASSPSSTISSSVPVSVTPLETTTYTLTSVANGCSYTDQVTLEVFGVLPVELLSFDVNCVEDNSKEIKWSTASERNSAYFSIEKSNDGIDWKEINRVEAAGNSTSIIQYAMIDNVIDDNTVYYRLNQFDNDGKSKLHDAVSAICKEGETIRIFPNPTTDGNFSLSKDVEYTIFDSVGNKINSIEKSGVYMLLIEGKLYKLVNL